jgi:glutamate synthase (NADPH) large chain
LDMKAGIEHWKIQGLDFSKIFHQVDMPNTVSRKNNDVQDHGLANALDNQLITLASNALETKQKINIDLPISNTNRTVGTMLSNQIAIRYGNLGLDDDTITVNFTGTSGQSFAAFLAKGITFNLTGEGNDYVGKGLCGGKIVIRKPDTFKGEAAENIIIGNTVMYGATTGEAYFSGVAGERFCVRNSGASAVVEGLGNHGCEYMTGGTVVVLGLTGGGVAYVYDIDGMFAKRCNMSMVSLEKVESTENSIGRIHHLNQPDEVTLKQMIENHAKYTGSTRALSMLADWSNYRTKFVKVMPNEYKRALIELAEDKALVAA